MPVYENIQVVQGEEITIGIEVDQIPSATGPYQELREIDGRLKETRDLFGEGMALAKNCATRVVDSMNQMGDTIKPDKFQLEFSVRLETEVGAIIAKTSTEAQLKVTMTWKAKEKKEP